MSSTGETSILEWVRDSAQVAVVVGITVFLVVAFTVFGENLPLKPLAMNNKMARVSSELGAHGTNFAVAVEPLKNGRPADVAKAQKAKSDVDALLQKAIPEFENAYPPYDKKEGGRQYLEKYRSFLASQKKISDECMGPAIQAIQDASLTNQAKWIRVRDLVNKAADIEFPAFKALQDAQKIFYEELALEAK